MRIDKYLLLLLSLLLFTFSVLYFFEGSMFVVRDDNVNYLLPQLKLQGDILFGSRQIPQINFYSYLGHPLMGQAQTGVLYLPRYVFYLMASWFGDFELMLLFEALSHVLLAGVSMYVLLGYLSVKKEYRVLGSYAYAFNGFLVEIGRNWLVVIAYYAYLPLLYLFTLKIARTQINIRTLVVLSFLRVVLFFIGHINFFVYIIFFELLVFVLSCRSKKNYLHYGLSHILSLIGYLPILLPMGHSVLVSARGDLNEQFTASVSVFQVLGSFLSFPCKEFVFKQTCSSLSYFNILAPIFFVSILLYIRKSSPKNIISSVYIVELRKLFERIWNSYKHVKFLMIGLAALLLLLTQGAILVDLSILGIFYVVWYKKRGSSDKHIALSLLLYLLSVALSLGVKSIFTYFALPIVLPFRWPFKWYLLSQFFLVIWLVLSLERLLDIRRNFKILVPAVVLVTIFVLTLFSGYFNPLYKSFSKISDLSFLNLIDARYVSVGSWESVGSISNVLADNSGAYYGKLSFGGYDPLVSRRKKDLTLTDHNNPVVETRERYLLLQDTLNVYGVKYYIVDNKAIQSAGYLADPSFVAVYTGREVSVYENTQAEPVVQDEKGNALNYVVSGNSIQVTVPQNVSQVRLGFLNEDTNWNAHLNMKPLVVKDDLDGRIVIPVDLQSGNLTVEYVDQLFFLGLKLSLVGYAVSFFAIMIMLSKRAI
jgi:hypothetical protein